MPPTHVVSKCKRTSALRASTSKRVYLEEKPLLDKPNLVHGAEPRASLPSASSSERPAKRPRTATAYVNELLQLKSLFEAGVATSAELADLKARFLSGDWRIQLCLHGILSKKNENVHADLYFCSQFCMNVHRFASWCASRRYDLTSWGLQRPRAGLAPEKVSNHLEISQEWCPYLFRSCCYF